MVKPEPNFSEAVRARITELTGCDPGSFTVGDIFPGPNYHKTSFEARVEAIAQSMVRISEGKCEILYPEGEPLDGHLLATKLPGAKP